MTRKRRYTAPVAAAAESLERRRRYSELANVLRELKIVYKMRPLGLAPKAEAFLDGVIDDIESGAA